MNPQHPGYEKGKIEGSDASCYIQWKGTVVCMDFVCPCGAWSHIDGDFVYFIHCTHCDAYYEVGTQVRFTRVEKPNATTIHEADNWKDDF